MAGVHCLVFEPDVTGHRLQHVRHLTDALLEIGCEVTLALQSDCRSHSEYDVHVKALEPHVQLYARLATQQSNSFAARRTRVSELLASIAETKPGRVYGPFMDGITQAAAIESLLHGSGPFHRVPIEAQIMHGRYAYPSRSVPETLRSAALRWLTRRNPWHVTHVLDPMALRGLEPLPDAKAFRLIPEPVEPLPKINQSDARRTLGLPVEGRYLGVIGGLHPRKGIDLLLNAFGVATLRPDDRLLFVGKMHPAIHDLIHTKHSNLMQQDRIAIVARYVSDHELGCGFLASDAVAVTHPRQIGSSGTLVRAAAAGRPVVASDFGWVGWATKTFQLGAAVDVANVNRFAAAIEEQLEAAAAFRLSQPASRFCAYHTIDNQKAHWLQSIGEELGLPLGRLASRIDWNWVLEAAAAK